ncbi:MAG: hypothetical protein ABI416_04920 [Ginsengibacter sp.]
MITERQLSRLTREEFYEVKFQIDTSKNNSRKVLPYPSTEKG